MVRLSRWKSQAASDTLVKRATNDKNSTVCGPTPTNPSNTDAILSEFYWSFNWVPTSQLCFLFLLKFRNNYFPCLRCRFTSFLTLSFEREFLCLQWQCENDTWYEHFPLYWTPFCSDREYWFQISTQGQHVRDRLSLLVQTLS